MQKRKALTLFALFFLLGCQPPGPPVSNGMPAAATPVLSILFAQVPAPVPGPLASWETSPFVAPGPGGSFGIMPLRTPQSNIKLLLDVPYPSTLIISGTDPATGTVTTIAQVPGGQPAPLTASFTVDNIDVSRVPARWTINLRLPPIAFTSYTVSIVDVSSNPIFTGTSQQSAPLVLPLGPSFKRLAVEVKIVGPGHVSSNAGTINCNLNLSPCSWYFAGSPQLITLEHGQGIDSSGNPLSTFSGWTGDCSGTGSCDLAQNGLNDFSVTATFVAVSSSVPPSTTCGGPTHPAGSITGASGGPTCGIVGAEAPSVECDSSGWFCCWDNAPSGGTADPRCTAVGYGHHHTSIPPRCGTGETLYADGCFTP